MAEEKPQTKKKGAKGGQEKVQTQYDEDFKHLVRLSGTDLAGTKKVLVALTGVKGVGVRLAALVADHAAVARDKKIGNCTDQEVEKLQQSLEAIMEFAPEWMVNRQRDIDSGEDLHLLTTDLEVFQKEDLNRLKKIRSYRGVRHENGLPVRGQRTRSNGRSGLTVGVQRKKA